ncbi:MAG: hypothetical protein V4584_04435 [Verrucomicrobiota bacterium]
MEFALVTLRELSSPENHLTMNTTLCCLCLFSFAAAALTTGCLVHEKVTVNGAVQEEGYAIKRPLKEAIENSQ